MEKGKEWNGMEELRKYSKNRNQVKILQALLNLHDAHLQVDGSFGEMTYKEARNWQRKCGLKVDGIVGRNTWKSLGVQETRKDVLVLKIPFANIVAQSMLLNNGQNYPFSKYSYQETYNFVINGGMFVMPVKSVDKKYWYLVTNDTIQKGMLINGGNTSNIGFAFCNDRKTGCIYASTTENSKGKLVDFIGGSPALYPERDDVGLSASYLKQMTYWNMIGVDKSNFYYGINFEKMRMNTLANQIKTCGAEAIINLDGGGSRALAVCQKIVFPTDGRGIPQAIGLNIKY